MLGLLPISQHEFRVSIAYCHSLDDKEPHTWEAIMPHTTSLPVDPSIEN
jgi:hypothetical protein